MAQFALQGSRVAFVDVDERSSERLVNSLAGCRHVPLFSRSDVTDLQALEATFKTLAQQVGPFRVLVNNAANDVRHAFGDVTPSAWDQSVAVNLRHQFFAAQYVANGMKPTGGAIINFGSISWMLKMNNLAAYATSKAAVQGLTRSLARELGPWKIRVNTLVPGWTMTEKQLREHVTPESRKEISKGQCLDCPLEPEHVARVVLFLASDDSEMCTGQDFIVDGGWV